MLTETFQYKQWADQRTLAAVRAINAETHAESLAYARQQLNHIVRVEELFRARLQGEPEPHATTNSEAVPPLDELAQRLAASDAWFARYAEQLAPADRDQAVTFNFVDGQRGSLSRLEILFHVINHGTYHRGAIGLTLSQAGAPRPADTYTVFIHEAQPSRREA